jgi:hypothetical protein
MHVRILKGFHYSTFFPKIYRFCSENKKSIRVKFDKSCVYKIDEKSCVNKLWGFSIGLFGVHKNSYRFGWTYENDKIIIWTYSYINGKLQKEKLTECEFDKEYQCSISIDNKVVFNFNGVTKERELRSTKKFLLELGFYFGGKTKAPNNMKIEFKRIK